MDPGVGGVPRWRQGNGSSSHSDWAQWYPRKLALLTELTAVLVSTEVAADVDPGVGGVPDGDRVMVPVATVLGTVVPTESCTTDRTDSCTCLYRGRC